MIRHGIVVHGGVGSPDTMSPYCRPPAEAGMAVLGKGGSALDAVLAATVALEDDGRFNAGSGSVVRLDGRTMEMDAGLMTSDGRIGAVAAVRRVKNPILLARRVMETPHILLCGAGALAFARRHGFDEREGVSENARRRYERAVAMIGSGEIRRYLASWEGFDLRANWNFDVPYEEVFGCDTIGAVALDEEGGLAAANSSGGTSAMLHGRIGDTPVVGAGFYAGPAAAVATTGTGEEIVRKMLAKQVYDWISQGEDVRRAAERGVALYGERPAMGVVAIARRGAAVAANRSMAASEILSGAWRRRTHGRR
ncbi:MAG: isoaspartyl peptidase/L-asparaginase [Planctomycetota bacterium]|jgi:isoaspartyl peptidase/L-asparaginase-like protein (Ntn-hydrolase superfamily)